LEWMTKSEWRCRQYARNQSLNPNTRGFAPLLPARGGVCEAFPLWSG
jgi:hypothetical protein